jgi:uncharacterized protein
MNQIDATSVPPPLPSKERLVELMIEAARMGRDDVIPALLQAGVDINGWDQKGYTPLIIASYNGRESTTALLLDRGADPDAVDAPKGNTALMGVAFKGHASIASLLLARGADVNKVNMVGQTALMMASLFNQTSIIDMLLAAGAATDIRDHAGNSAQSVAASQGNLCLQAKLVGYR